MDNTPSLSEINKTANMNTNLLTRHYKLKLMNDFLNNKYQNPKFKQSEIANQLDISSSTVEKYRNDINMLSPYRINQNNGKKRTKKALNTDFDKNSHHEADIQRPQMTSNDLKRPQSTANENSKKTKMKNNLKGGYVRENIEIDEHFLDKVLRNNSTWTLICVIISVYSYSFTSMMIILYKIVFVHLQ